MKFLVIFFLLISVCFAGEVLIPDYGKISYEDKYSLKDFTGKILLDKDPVEFEGKIIYGSCFSQEEPNTKVFPENIKKITFINCNLDNIKINKPGWVTIGCSERKFKVQADKKDWLLDDNLNPVKPLNEE